VLIHSRILTMCPTFRCLETNFTETCLPRQNNARLNTVLLEYVIKADYKGESAQFVLLVHGIRFFATCLSAYGQIVKRVNMGSRSPVFFIEKASVSILLLVYR